MTMTFVAAGVGDAFSALHYSTCLAVEAEGAVLLLECPHPIRKMLHDAGVDAGRVIAAAVTHLHADHSSGLEGLGYLSRSALGRRAKIAMHPDVSARLWEGHLAAGMERLMPGPGAPPQPMSLADYFELIALDEAREIEVGPFRIGCRRTIHHIPTTALRVRAGGRLLSYSADTAYDPALIEWLSAADLVVHEANHGVHTPYEKLAALPADLRRGMRLIHCPDGFEAREIELLRQGRRYEV